MPTFKSDGRWFPVDEAAKQELKAKGVEFLGMKNQRVSGPTASIYHTYEKDQGVMPVATFPKVAQNKLDGIRVAEPTAEQRAYLDKKKEVA